MSHNSDLFDAAPKNTADALKAAASILHTRITLSVTESFKTLTKTHPMDDAKNAVVSSVISALAELIVAWNLDPEYMTVVLHEQLRRLYEPIELIKPSC